MQKNYTRALTSLLVFALGIIPLFSASLSDIVQKALASSSQIQSYQLIKSNSDLAVSISDSENQLGIEVKSGEVSTTYDNTLDGYIFGTSDASVTFTLPDEGDTSITVGTGSTQCMPSNSGYSISPYVAAGHTITYGETGDERSTLLSKQNSLLGNYTYDSNVTSFQSSLFEQVISLLTIEKSIKETEKKIADLKTEIENSLKLKTMDEKSLSYQGKMNTLESLRSSLASFQSNATLVKQQYTVLTGLVWEGVSDIPVPDLSFTPNPKGNTSVALKALAWDIAKEDLKFEQAKQTNRTLGLSGSVSVPSTNVTTANTIGSDITRVKGSIGGQFSAKTFSLGASASGSYNFDSGDFTPTLTVSGSWNNNSTSLVDKLNMQKLENQVMLAQIDYSNALTKYLYDASSLNGEIAAWNLAQALMENTVLYHTQVLQQQRTLLEKGLARLSDVEDAAFTVELDSYEANIQLLNGLVLQNKIHSLQL
ncbi:hypothetical protein SpiGrapes_1206 [Sphaerochaeta pleomorpha str. Grapes]|uniref:Outer membrane protein n=1 Tax=Sphaerochaeta pleomorpha (strain ATCC BAA-1885 / DSM 22778 / Grapes) TaxID=158190 RepID=G8QSR2_SPHPG|nr:hypothetical protein [Sphaerochaeta pleomorpha]AEV29023.1 hypothetical protein SpiGrapes_1206 [Sphaerochaeta pleomorpha str. Grapes]